VWYVMTSTLDAPLAESATAPVATVALREAEADQTPTPTVDETSREAYPRPRRRLRHQLTRAAESLTTPLLPADYLDLFAPLRSGADLRGRIEQVVPETKDAATIVIRPGADWAGHVPGQYLRIGIDVDGVRQWRAYSLTHGPRPDGRISITVKAVPDGVVSNHLVHQARPGTLVHLEQAAGEFVLPPGGGKYLFVTAGSGITPVIGMLRNLFPSTDEGVLRPQRSEVHDITVVHVAPSEPDSIFLRDLKALAAAGAIRLVARYDDEHGVLDVNTLSDLVPDLGQRRTLGCGPAPLLAALEAHHDALGLDLTTEQFRTSRVEPGEGGTVTFADGREVDADGGTPILEAAEDAGVLMPSGCRMGICYGCVLPMREGSVRDLRNGEVTTAVPGEGGPVKVQTCINAAAGPCHLEHS
jgi:ferredoxin-NADP reductase